MLSVSRLNHLIERLIQAKYHYRISIILYCAIITVFVSSYWADRKFHNVKQLELPPTCLQNYWNNNE